MPVGGDVVYLPSQRRETLGGDIGGLIGAAIGSSMLRQQQQQKLEEQQQFVGAIQKAKDRATAMEVVSNYSGKFRTPQDFTTALRMVDEFHPASIETPTPITAYSPTTGEPTTVFPNRREMVDKKWWEGQGVTLTKPDMSDFYQPVPADPNAPAGADQQYQHVGKLPVGQRPEGAVTLQELTLARQGRAEGRADERLAMMEENQRRAEERTNKLISSLVRQEQGTVKTAVNLAATSLNARTLPDGTWDFGGDVSKVDQFVKMVDYINTRVEANPKMLSSPTAASRLFTEARKAVVGMAEDRPPPPPPPAKPKGKISQLVDKVLGTDDKKPTDDKSVASTMSAADKQASITSAKAAADRVRTSTTMSPAEKKAALATIRKRLKDAGIQGDI